MTKIPYDFKLVDRDDSVWLEWYDDDLIDHGVDVYSLAALIEDMWRKKKAKDAEHETN